jgi:hypothetical protein
MWRRRQNNNSTPYKCKTKNSSVWYPYGTTEELVYREKTTVGRTGSNARVQGELEHEGFTGMRARREKRQVLL